jgi:hypothetical protein
MSFENGCLITVNQGEGSPVTWVWQEEEEDEGGNMARLASVLGDLVEAVAPTSRYSPARVMIRVEPGDKWEGEADEGKVTEASQSATVPGGHGRVEGTPEEGLVASDEGQHWFFLGNRAREILRSLSNRVKMPLGILLDLMVQEFGPSTPAERSRQAKEREEARRSYLKQAGGTNWTPSSAWTAGFRTGWKLFQVRKDTSFYKRIGRVT